MFENHTFFKFAFCVEHKNNNFQDWFCKRKVALKTLRRKNPRGGQICPPPLGQLGLKLLVGFLSVYYLSNNKQCCSKVMALKKSGF